MKKILQIIVNYHSEEDTLQYINSICESKSIIDSVTLDIILVDNSITKSKLLRDEVLLMDRNIKIIDNENVGYFGAFKVALESVGYKNVLLYDHVIISNVDVKLNLDFFSELQKINKNSNIGVLAPSIVSEFRGNDLNPKIMKKPKKNRIYLNYMLFKYPLLFKLYAELSNKKIKKNTLAYKAQKIYAPHGSFIIFNKIFFELGGVIDYPIFLFGEEIYVAEVMKKIGLEVHYTPSLKILDSDHGSTSKESRKFIANEHRKALVFILKNYY